MFSHAIWRRCIILHRFQPVRLGRVTNTQGVVQRFPFEGAPVCIRGPVRTWGAPKSLQDGGYGGSSVFIPSACRLTGHSETSALAGLLVTELQCQHVCFRDFLLFCSSHTLPEALEPPIQVRVLFHYFFLILFCVFIYVIILERFC